MHRDECPLFDLNLSVCCNWNILDVFGAQLRNLMSSFFSPNQIVLFANLNFYFTKTANIPVYGNIAVYIKYCAVSKKKIIH